jgi:CheY-like chemotaxis protein
MKKILIFDDYASNSDLPAEELAAEGNMVFATGKQECILESVTSLNTDLIILDPYVKGKMIWHLLAAIKAFRPRIPILIFTASLRPEESPTHFANTWIRKSFFFDELKQGIAHLLATPRKDENAPDFPFGPYSERKAS